MLDCEGERSPRALPELGRRPALSLDGPAPARRVHGGRGRRGLRREALGAAFVARSCVVLSDAGDMLPDVGPIGGALWARRLAARPAAGVWTFGWKRAEI